VACSERIRAAKGIPVTANELLVMLGRAWSRLLLYPGGLAAFGIIWLISVLQSRESPRGYPTENRVFDQREGYWFLVLGSIVPPWLALALLPLPLAVALPRQLDIVVVLALLEWPNLLAIRQELRAGDMRHLAATLNSYPPLILATLALAQAAHSLELVALARVPDDTASMSTLWLHWLGVVALALALPAAIGLGPFAGDQPFEHAQGERSISRRRNSQPPTPNSQPPTPILIGLRLRALGLVMLAALPWAGTEGTGLALLRMLGAAALIAALLWAFDRLTRGQAPGRWAWAYLGLNAVLLLALLGAAYLALQLRLA
jgi:hypothetical protein